LVENWPNLITLIDCHDLEGSLRPILNFTPRGKLWPPGPKLYRGEFVP
jgi:hypothetical protein